MAAARLFHRPAPLAAVSVLALLAGCSEPLDFDLRRNLGSDFSTTAAVTELSDRPRPDTRGVISYPNYQVVVAQPDDSVRTIAARLDLNADDLARYNGIDPDIPLRQGELVALPSRVAETSPTAGGGAIQSSNVNVTELASAAIDRAAPRQPASQPSAATPPSAPPAGAEPIRHRVQRGETAYSVSRLYGVPVGDIADWNGLGPELVVREGQVLLVPQGGAARPQTAAVTQPGTQSPAPPPPSAAQPLPAEEPSKTAPAAPPSPPAPDLRAERSEPAKTSRFVMPVEGSIIRAYAPGRNEGIDIGVPAGTAVRAADAGTVAAVTTDTKGASIVVIRHSDGLLTVYVNLEQLNVAKDDTVSKGQTIARIPAGEPSFLHFEVRDGLESVDPTNYLP